MKSAWERSIIFHVASVGVAFLMLVLSTQVVYADEHENTLEVEAALFEETTDAEDGATSTDLTPDLLEFSLGHIDDSKNIDVERVPSLWSFSVEGIKDVSVKMSVFAFLFLLLFVMIAFLIRSESAKKYVFTIMVLLITIPSVFFIASTIYMNVVSETGGPVHWHTDFRVFACGEELPPPTPEGRLSNKTGTPVLHQHVDKRLHVEGVLIDMQDASFQNFVRVQGGELTSTSFKVPTGESYREFSNGDTCPDGKPGEWNVFLYEVDVDTNEVSKSKIKDYVNYVPAPHIEVPPGDCLIFEFGPRMSDTEQICNFYQIEISKGNLTPTWIQ